MTQPAEITSPYDWAQLVREMRLLHRYINDIYQRISGPDDTDADNAAPGRPREQPLPDRDNLPYRRDDPSADDRAAERNEERLTRLDFETDGRLDGDYDREPADGRSRDVPVEQVSRAPSGRWAYEGAEHETDAEAELGNSYGERLTEQYLDQMERLDAAGVLDDPDADQSWWQGNPTGPDDTDPSLEA